MQDKLQKILNIKVDAINKNIENLNYLNGELDKNNENLSYIKEMISLFKNNEILNFDKISKEEFEKVLLMIDPSISDIFRSKTCSYEGIIYIIEGIRKSISLELTEEQNNAILSFVEGMRMKSLNLQDVIANLNESKDRLPETNLESLNDNLEKYEDIISKLENNIYLKEIDEIEDALDFSEVTLEEKADLFEYLLKYNADIYSSKEEEVEKEEIEEKPAVELPEFRYEPFDINAELNIPESNVSEEQNFDLDEEPKNVEEQSFDLNEEPKVEPMPTLEEIKINLDQMNKDLNLNEIENGTEQSNELPLTNEPTFFEESKEPEVTNEEPIDNSTVIPVEMHENIENIPSTEENGELNTVELEDIIKKIDAKLKEMDNEETNEKEEISLTEPVTETAINYTDILNKYALPELSISGKSLEEVDSILSYLNDNELLEELKQDKTLLSNLLTNSSVKRFEELSELIKEYLLVKKEEYDYVLDTIIQTMPIILINEEAFNSFKANLEFFKEHKLNVINLFDNYRELLIINNDLLKENYNDIKMYGLELNNDNVKYYLYNKNLLNNIDLYLEAIGFEKGFLGKEEHFDGLEYIIKNPYKLNEISRDTLMKLRYASEINNKIYGNKPGILSGEISNPKVDVLTLPEDYKNQFFNGEYTFIDKNELATIKDEINNLKDYNLTLDENINKLDNSYKNSELRYKIGDILISRIKTIRVYNFLKNKNIPLKNALLVALTYNTVLKIEEYEQIKTVVDAIVEGGN